MQQALNLRTNQKTNVIAKYLRIGDIIGDRAKKVGQGVLYLHARQNAQKVANQTGRTVVIPYDIIKGDTMWQTFTPDE